MEPLEVDIPTVDEGHGGRPRRRSSLDRDALARGEERTEERGGSVLAEVLQICAADGEGSLRALRIVFVITSGFTLAQLVGSYLANSLSMYGDTLTMGLDSMTYALNIYAEKRKLKDRRSATASAASAAALDRLDAMVAVISLLTLVGVTLYIIVDACARLRSEVGVDPVSAQIMLGFTSANLVMNFFSCSAFLRSPACKRSKYMLPVRPHHDAVGNADLDADIDFAGSFLGNESGSEDGETFEEGHFEESQELRRASRRNELSEDSDRHENLNVLSAFVHLLADTARSLTVFITSIYVEASGGDAVYADAVSSIVVCVLILLAALFLFYETAKRLRALARQGSRDRSLSTAHNFEPVGDGRSADELAIH